ncbi:MAG: FAD-dependent oxidoreductase, partial [Pseudomonadota bacterium]
MAGIVIAGGGQAGFALAAKLRNLGFDGPVTLFAQENEPPYQRPPLSKAYLLGDMEKERLYFRPRSFYEEQNITLHLDTPVLEIDPGAKTIATKSGDMSYDHLALTTGSVARRLPERIGGDLKGVYVVRTLGDVDAMANNMRKGAKAVIIGGGYIGLEAAAVAAKSGLDVTLIEMAERILQRVAAPETSDYFRALHASKGVKIIEGMGVAAVQGRDRVERVLLSDGTSIEASFVVAGIGIMPADALAMAAGLACDNGIKVNALGQTSDPSIWAAGDCASLPYRGDRIRLESVQNAIDQAEAVAANMLGADTAYVPKPWFWSDQYDIKLQIAGLNTGYDSIAIRDIDGARSHWYYQGDRLLAVDAMNAPRDY